MTLNWVKRYSRGVMLFTPNPALGAMPTAMPELSSLKSPKPPSGAMKTTIKITLKTARIA